ncbi:MAG: cytochrome c oxidase subunit II, partial [Sphingomonas sp.]
MRTAQTKHRSKRGLAAFGALLLTSSQALAAGIGQPEPWQMDRQVPVTENARDILQFESWVHWLSLAICVFVLGLILWC